MKNYKRYLGETLTGSFQDYMLFVPIVKLRISFRNHQCVMKGYMCGFIVRLYRVRSLKTCQVKLFARQSTTILEKHKTLPVL